MSTRTLERTGRPLTDPLKKAGAPQRSQGESLESSRGPVASRWVSRWRRGTSLGVLLTRVRGRSQSRGRGASAFFGRGCRRRLGVSRRWRGSFLGRRAISRVRRFRIRPLRGGVFRPRPLGSGFAIVGHVPPRAFELESRRRNQSFDGSPAGGAFGKRIVRELLKCLETTAFLAVVFVKRHGYCLFSEKRPKELSIATLIGRKAQEASGSP